MMVPVVIPFYKNQSQLDKCLEHLQRQTVSVDVYIHDNSDDNIYFTAAVNEGLRHFLRSDGPKPYVIILNQDMYLESHAVEEMVKFMDAHRKCGIGMPLQLSATDPGHVIFAGGFQAFPIGTAAIGPLSSFTEDREIRWADGGCLILRKTMIEEIGLLDENMRLVGSDSDYCFTARSRGWEVWNIVKARGIHDRGAAAAQHVGLELSMVKATDMDYYARKWCTGELYRDLNHRHVDCSPQKVGQELAHIRRIEAMMRETIERVGSGVDTADIAGV